ncbi:hypothetical protein LX32DRAFT_642130 [Colletotrichum zoysiae]|uniref:Uncharacterized protein n=1 Tax=Colletotrichum zoysiae TaxID=1216348 RepID=A0AAD9HDL0_9PEZI|nr:hypothetical protein LX32DRAFT_642130 [Colletotrichum zoysiae]
MPDTYGARTLAELPTHSVHYGQDAFQQTCLNMISTGIHKWGFVIYRCAYDDDELWNRYLAQLKSFYHDNLVKERRAELLEPYLDLTVIEDQATLDNASRFEVRKHFNQWLSGQNIPKLSAHDYTHIARPIRLPRFRYCLYVDKQCLDTVTQFQAANDGTALFPDLVQPMVYALIDRAWTPNGTEDPHDPFEALRKKTLEEADDEEEDDDEEDAFERGHPLIDGSDHRYVGWQYCNAIYVGTTYDELHRRSGLEHVDSYCRPPAIYPCGDVSMPS